ncbi:MAG: 6-bladed beta-propeller [Gemmatimonadota bacterium]
MPVTVVLIAAWGCDRGSEIPPVLGRDSAGISIVENSQAALDAAPVWVVDTIPAIDIGGDPEDEDQLFVRVVRARRTSEGSIWIADAGATQIRGFDREGGLIHRLGRKGEGPGEFTRLADLLVVNDTIMALDSGLRRISVWSTTGKLLDTRTLGGGRVVPFAPLQRAGDGSLWIEWMDEPPYSLTQDGRAPFGSAVRSSSTILRYGPEDGVGAPLGTFPGYEEAVWTREGRPLMSAAPLARSLVFGVHDDRVYLGTQETYEIETWSTDGRRLRLIRGPAVDLTVTEAQVQDWAASAASTYPDPDPARRAELAQFLSEPPHPRTGPAYGSLLIDPQGSVWVSEPTWARLPPAPSWTIYDPDGAVRATIRLPEGFRVFEIGDDYVLGLWTDELGVEHVREHHLTRGTQ